MEEKLKSYTCYYAGMVFEVKAANRIEALEKSVLQITQDIRTRVIIAEDEEIVEKC